MKFMLKVVDLIMKSENILQNDEPKQEKSFNIKENG